MLCQRSAGLKYQLWKLKNRHPYHLSDSAHGWSRRLPRLHTVLSPLVLFPGSLTCPGSNDDLTCLLPQLLPYLFISKPMSLVISLGDINPSWQQAWSGKQWFRVGRVNGLESLYQRCLEGHWSLVMACAGSPSLLVLLFGPRLISRPYSESGEVLLQGLSCSCLFLHPDISLGLSPCLPIQVCSLWAPTPAIRMHLPDFAFFPTWWQWVSWVTVQIIITHHFMYVTEKMHVKEIASM